MSKFLIFHQSFSNSAGTERVLYNIAEHLSKDKANDVTLLLCEVSKNLVYGIDKLDIEIDSLGLESIGKGRASLLKYYYSVSKHVNEYFRKIGPDEKVSIICSNPLLAAIVYFKTKKRSNLKVISCEHFSFHISGKFSRLLRKLFYPKIAVVALTERDRRLIQEQFNPKICVCIPNAIPFELEKYGGLDKNTILSIGRYTHQKGFDLLLQAVGEMDRQLFNDWKLLIIGDDFGDRPLMESIINEKELDFVELIPSTPHIISYYKSASFYVMSSRYEGLPMVLLEAMGFGLPLISFDCPTGPSEIVNSNNGVLVPDGDLKALASAIELFIKDRSILLEKAKGSEEEAIKFNKSNINLLWDSLFKELWKTS